MHVEMLFCVGRRDSDFGHRSEEDTFSLFYGVGVKQSPGQELGDGPEGGRVRRGTGALARGL